MQSPPTTTNDPRQKRPAILAGTGKLPKRSPQKRSMMLAGIGKLPKGDYKPCGSILTESLS